MTRRLAPACLALLALLAPAAPAAAVTPERAALVIGAIRDYGCRMDEEPADRLFDPMGIPRSDTADIVAVLESAGLASVSPDGGTVTLSQELCAADPAEDAATYAAAEAAAEAADGGEPAERAARFIAAVRDNGCAMTETEAATGLAAMGFTADETVGYVEVLLEAGLVTLSDDFQQLRLAEALCAADPAADAAAFATALAAFEAARPEPEPLDAASLLALVRDEFGPGAVAEMAAFQATMEGCTLERADRAALAAALREMMAEHVSMVFAVPLPLPEPVSAELAAAVDGFLADPGPEFSIEDGRIVLTDCTP